MTDWRAHPEEGELIRYGDGELRAKETERIGRHLETCRDCRRRADNLQQAMGAYLRYRRDVLEPAVPPPPQPWQDLRAEFAHVRPRRIGPRRAVWLIACAATAGTGILLYRAGEPKPAIPPQAIRPASASPAPRRMAPPPPPAARKASPGPEDELRVIAALDRIGADLGDPIEVVRTSRAITVTCSGLAAERLRQVRGALDGMPGVVVRVPPEPATGPAGSPLEVNGAPPAAADPVFVDGLLEHSESMMAHAHVLRSLAARFPAPVEAAMRADARNSLADIRQRHAAAVSREVSALSRALAPRLGPLPAGTPASEDWQAGAMRLFADAEQVDRLIGTVFAGHGTAGARGRPAELAAALGRLAAETR